MHHILKNTILSTHWFLSLYLFIYIYCSISIIKINKFTSLYILGTLWWEGGGTLPVFIYKNTPPMGGGIFLAEMKYSLAPPVAGLWGIPDGFAVLCLQNLLIVEPGNHRLQTLRPHCQHPQE